MTIQPSFHLKIHKMYCKETQHYLYTKIHYKSENLINIILLIRINFIILIFL